MPLHNAWQKVCQSASTVSHFKGTMIVNFHEIARPLRETLPALLTEVRHDVLYEAVSIVLFRQQLQRIDQIPA